VSYASLLFLFFLLLLAVLLQGTASLGLVAGAFSLVRGALLVVDPSHTTTDGVKFKAQFTGHLPLQVGQGDEWSQ